MTRAAAVELGDELARTLDVEAAILEAMVLASQRQIAAILSYKLDLRRESPDALLASQGELAALTKSLAPANEAIRMASDAILPGAGPMSAAKTLPPRAAEKVGEKLSIIRSLAQALTELQRVTQFHAQRGLQIVEAWKGLLDPDGTTATYQRHGKTRRVVRTPPPSRVLEVDL